MTPKAIRKDPVSGHASLRAHSILALSLLTALGVTGLEHFAHRIQVGEMNWIVSGLVVHMLLDVALLAVLASLTLVLALRLKSWLRPQGQAWAGLLGTVAIASLLFALGMMGTTLPRDELHESIGSRYGLAMAEQPGPRPQASDLTLQRTDTALCSYRGTGWGSLPQENWTLAQSARFSFRRTAVSLAAFLPLLLVGLTLAFRRRLSWISLSTMPASKRRLYRQRILRWCAIGSMIVTASIFFSQPSVESASDTTRFISAAAFNGCTEGGPARSYDVSAIEVKMTLNRFGNNDPDAFMYVLDQNIPAVRAEEALGEVSGGLRKDLIQPLVLRANLGECLTINFTNELSAPASLSLLGLPHTVNDAGGEVGLNPNTFADPGTTISYQIPIPDDPGAERAYYFFDHGASRQRVAHGLFGALVAEPAGSTYLDPETGAALAGFNWEAIIVDPGGDNFREFVIFYHEVGDESFTNIREGQTGGKKLPQLDQASGIYRPGARALNYRSEPFLNRMDLKQDKSLGYSSYTFGDPATPIPRSYVGEPTKTRLLHGGSEMFHVHHLHGGAIRWRRNPMSDPNLDYTGGLNKEPAQNVFSTHLDSQSVGPGTSYDLLHECGAGGCQQAAGDFLYHCHIGQHYIAGMWSLWRVHDTLQPDLATIPGNSPPEAPVSAWGLLFANSGRTYNGKRLVLTVNDPLTEQLLSEFIETQLPPPGNPIDDQDATVWDWISALEGGDPSRPIYLGEPDDTTSWANFTSPIPGQRPEVLFNFGNGRYTWPLFRPHLGQRPPFSPNGHSGAPWLGEQGDADRPDGLCPDDSLLAAPAPGRITRSYPITAVSVPVEVTDGGVDPDGKIFVLNEDKAQVLAGTKPAEPLVVRSNVQDCTEIIFTNEIPDSADSENFSKVNMHHHFMQFDPQASDGVITGFSYEQSVRPYANENRTLQANAPAGAVTLSVNNTNRLVPGVWIGVGLGEGICTPGGGAPVACTEVRRIVSLTPTSITLDAPLTFSHSAGEAVGVEFVRYNLYADVDTGTVFWHDHVNFMNWDHGLFGAHVIEPAGSSYHSPVSGLEVRSGAIADIHALPTASVGAGQSGSFREFVVLLHNNSPVNGGVNFGGTINLRAAPFSSRGGDIGHLFSSVTHDDPITPLPRAYIGDPFVIRGLGVVERLGGLRLTGHRFRVERFASSAPLTDTTHIGISERFDLVLEGGAGGLNGAPGDYLYYSTIGRNFETGAWGILRVHDTLQGDLQVLPDRAAPPAGAGFPDLTFTGGAPPPAAGPGDPCPGGAPLRSYAVRISPSTIIYQDSPQISDAAAVVYTLDSGSDPAQVREPLVVRANQGDCVEITLTNTTGNRASLNMGELLFDPQGSHGSAIGFNRDSTVAPGGSLTYRLFADQDVGAALFYNLADPNSLPRGAYGALVVEPAGSQFLDPATGTPIDSGILAEIVAPGGTFREMVVLFSDEDTDIGQNVMPYPTAIAGHSGLSYSREDLSDRDSGTDPSGVFSSTLHNDPRLVLQALADTPITVRVGQPFGEQPHVFSIEGHRFGQDAGLTGTELLSSQLLVPGLNFDAVLVNGAGAGFQFEGDYLFFDNRDPFTETGLWGILRVGAGGGPPPVCELAEVGEPCLNDSDCCSGACSNGNPANRVCLAQ